MILNHWKKVFYKMVDRVQSDRRKTTKKGDHAKNTKAYKHLPV